MPRVSEQVEWLSLVDISGPFLAPAVLEQVFPQGLEKIATPRRQRIRSAYEEWRDAVDADDSQLAEMHEAWVLMVLQEMLEYEEAVLITRQALDGKCVYRAPEHGVETAPDYAVQGDDAQCRLLIAVWPPDTDLEKAVSGDAWPASPLERMTLLCRANDVRVGLVTDGEQWMMVNAPVGATSGYAAWLARLWWQEPITLKAFQSLLGVRRCFGPKEETLDSLLERSTEFQEEVTDTLGQQVRRAVEILVQSLGRADQDRNSELLKDVSPSELYEAGLTVMMRLVFTLCAEERGLLLLGDPLYDQDYAVSTLRARLREDADHFGLEVLERRHDAWSRLLAVFRAIYGGIEHESLRMPALGGSLFDPDRFPLLEGRAKGTTWREHRSIPLPIDNRTVLLLLDALQVLEHTGGAQLLSYRALDVEQIGHVYEGLLEYTVAKLDKVTVGLIGSQKVRHPSITLDDLERIESQGREAAVACLAEVTGRSAAALDNALTSESEATVWVRLVHACGGDEKLARRLRPFTAILRSDSWGTMLVYRPGSFAIVHGSDRRETGTHYTPKSLTQSIAETTLGAIVYRGPAEGTPRECWELKTPHEILDLRICDVAMGSGAFLVQACRYLGERLVEAWAHAEAKGKAVTADGVVVDERGGLEPMPKSLDERLILARRLIAERCLYGVDVNPLAVELAKLSIWLVTMAKARPFGFLDHNMRSGDSLLGVHRLDQLTKLTMAPDTRGHQERLFGRNTGKSVEEAVDIRLRLRAIPIRDVRDVEMMARLNAEACRKLESVELVADALIGIVLANSRQPRLIATELDALAVEAGAFLSGNVEAGERIARRATAQLSLELPDGRSSRKPFHWPLAFPEVFRDGNGGFDAIVGNPPFLGGKRICLVLGDAYNCALKLLYEQSKGAADLCAYFFRRVGLLIGPTGAFGLLATNTISQADTREVGLEVLAAQGISLFNATTLIVWPGSANVHVSVVHGTRLAWRGTRCLDGRLVESITPQLTSGLTISAKPYQLKTVFPRASGGTGLLGIGFVIDRSTYDSWIMNDPRYREILWPYINGKELNSMVDSAPPRFVINFENRSEKEAERYPLAIRRVRELVKPERDVLTRQIHESCYWKHWDKRERLYGEIARLKRVLVCSFVSKHLPFTFLPTGWVYSKELVVIPTDDASQFAILQSSFHSLWVRHFSGTLKSDLSYSISDGLRTFALPSGDMAACRSRGEAYFKHRTSIQRSREEGLTGVYNRFHDPAENADDVVRLREMHVAIDAAVAAAYGWRDLAMAHAFRNTKQGMRFTISESASGTILDRLLALNHERYREEEKAGLHSRKGKKAEAS